ncbi:hypothetical protein K469DRAFT_689451 [Zopfia rhizophila CBS 207.26]|uniref:DUF7820 domain-containing protein n=1 Tax=Zopfia rhizophila CBS 207.26 TaxID=1314779 RepID=A0A6A6DZ89_9PEZI|nr:hypothetical protein K469DRAFT_689451 [Zopfia rhizophila CBS 207.26]
MPFPRRSVRSIQNLQLPSLQTTFSGNHGRGTTRNALAGNSAVPIEDGIELVPIERQNSTCNKQLTPGREGKEVVPNTKLPCNITVKPLPNLPGTRWSRMAVKYRIIILLCIQGCMVLATGLSLVAAKRQDSQRLSNPPSSSTASVTPNTSAPIPSIPPLQRGTFAIVGRQLKSEDSRCLAQNNESLAWSCVPAPGALRLSLLPSPANQINLTIVSLGPLAVDNFTWYGVQAPEIQPTSLTSIVDPEHPTYGPAYHFRSTYNRTVLLKENQIVDGSRRPDPPDPTTGFSVAIGDRPWFCAFNETAIEGFIYISRNFSSENRSIITMQDGKAVKTMQLPYMVKIREERLPNTTRPYCLQMEMMGNKKLLPVATVNLLKLSETGSTLQQARENEFSEGIEREKGQIIPPNSCHCQWMVE